MRIIVRFETRPMAGESIGGDIAVARQVDDLGMVALIDVAGHGRAAHDLALQCEDVLLRWTGDPAKPTDIMLDLHDRCRRSRGLVAGIGIMDLSKGELEYSSIGNVVARLYSGGDSVELIARPGLIGRNLRFRPRAQHVNLVPGDLLLMHSDGVSSRFRLNKEELARTEDAIVSDVLDANGKTTDDASCLVCRMTA